MKSQTTREVSIVLSNEKQSRERRGRPRVGGEDASDTNWKV